MQAVWIQNSRYEGFMTFAVWWQQADCILLQTFIMWIDYFRGTSFLKRRESGGGVFIIIINKLLCTLVCVCGQWNSRRSSRCNNLYTDIFSHSPCSGFERKKWVSFKNKTFLDLNFFFKFMLFFHTLFSIGLTHKLPIHFKIRTKTLSLGLDRRTQLQAGPWGVIKGGLK